MVVSMCLQMRQSSSGWLTWYESSTSHSRHSHDLPDHVLAVSSHATSPVLQLTTTVFITHAT